MKVVCPGKLKKSPFSSFLRQKHFQVRFPVGNQKHPKQVNPKPETA